MIKNIEEVHDELYKFLKQKNQEDKEFKFTTRITNRSNRLEQGYWFHGNEYYIAISFWKGNDWMNKTPNIYFCVTDTECFLLISVSDSDVKRNFVESALLKRLELFSNGRYYLHIADVTLDNFDYLDALKSFLTDVKPAIDAAIKENEIVLGDDYNPIGFIEDTKFKKWTDRIDDYRAYLAAKRREEKIDEILNEDIEPLIIRKIEIKAFPGLTACTIDNIPENNRCIFLTGENGTGKSSILKAIGSGLTNDHEIIDDYEKSNYHDEEYYDLTIDLARINSTEAAPIVIEFNRKKKPSSPSVEIPGYAAYGPYRLMTNQTKDGQPTQSESTGDMGPNGSLFLHNAPLIDIEEGLRAFVDKFGNDYVDQRKDIIEEVISNIIPKFNGMIWGEYIENRKWQPTKYRIGPKHDSKDKVVNVDENNITVSFYKLATGARSVLAMIGDMVIRLIRQQPDVEDIANLNGIVLIDEIDIHLHPTFQKLLVKQLTESFPKIQFIISTHSPVPLLGAPENSIFFVVKKNYDQETIIERIDDVEVRNLTPDTILTSPIFGMQDILNSQYDYDYEFPEENKSFEKLRTEGSWDGVKVADAELESLLRKYQQRKGGVA